jgi:flagellar biosynthesis GTPase FlhF
MFYYLIYNSSYIKKKENKDKSLYTLIYGSIVYIILHALLSFTFKSDVIKYFWIIFLIDCASIYLSSDFDGFSSINIINYEKENKLQEINLGGERNSIIEDYIDKHTENKKPEKKPEKKKAKANNKKENSKSVSFKESTPISILKKESVDEYDREEAENINLTLESLGKLEQEEDNKKIGSNSISDLQNRFLKKKMEDEYSDPGSDIDLEQFEKSITEN